MELGAQDLTAQIVDFVKTAPLWLSCFALFFGAFIEYVFPPFPGDSVLIAGGFFIATGAIPVIPSVLALLVGSVAGCVVAWWLGTLSLRHEGSRRFLNRYVGEQNLKRLEGVYARHGIWILIVNRFIPGLRGASMIGAGMARISLVNVIIFGLISSILWNGVLIALGFLVSGSLPALINLVENYSLIMIAIVVAVIAYFVFFRR